MVTVALYGLEADDWSALEREVVDLFTALLRVDTTNPPGNETACALVLQDYLAGNGIASTLVGRDHVHVAHQGQRGAGTGAVEARNEVLPLRRLADESARDAVARQVVLEDERAGGLVAGRVGGVDAQQGGEEVDDFTLKSAPVVGLETVQRHRHHPCPRGRRTHCGS